MRQAIYYIIVGVGLIQIIGFLLGAKIIKDLGTVTASAPLPIVFTEVEGIELFANTFFVRYTAEDGQVNEVKITPEIYSKLKGPYNRRNVYGAAIAGGPILPEKLWKSVLTHGFCDQKLSAEMGFAGEMDDIAIIIRRQTGGVQEEWTFPIECEP